LGVVAVIAVEQFHAVPKWKDRKNYNPAVHRFTKKIAE